MPNVKAVALTASKHRASGAERNLTGCIVTLPPNLGSALSVIVWN